MTEGREKTTSDIEILHRYVDTLLVQHTLYSNIDTRILYVLYTYVYSCDILYVLPVLGRGEIVLGVRVSERWVRSFDFGMRPNLIAVGKKVG